MKKIGLVLAFAALGFAANAQKNATKIDATAGFVSTMYGITQERAINDRLSIQTQFRFKPKQILPINDLLGAEYEGDEYNPWANPEFSGWANITELRIYGKEKGALKGFYWGPYINYTNHKVQSDEVYAEFTDDNNVTYFADVQQTIRLKNIGMGIQIGTQKVWDGGFVLNWTILGVGFNSYTLSGEIAARNTSGNFDFRNYDDEVNEAYLELDKYAPTTVKLEKESAIISATLPQIHLRMGLALGFGYGN